MPKYPNKIIIGTDIALDLTSDTVTPSVLLSGYTAHDASGAIITGTVTGGEETNLYASDIAPSEPENGELWVDYSEDVGGDPIIEPLPITENGTYSAPAGIDGYSPITVNVQGSGGVAKNDVNFYDYDGTVVASYAASDFANLTAMPSNPSHTGLTAQGWNWSLSDAKSYVASYGKLDIGQMYITDDGKTRLYIDIPEGASGTQLRFCVRYTQTVSNGVTVDWGDGNSETFTGTTATDHYHDYLSAGKYVVTMDVNSGTLSFVGSSSVSIYGTHLNSCYATRIYKAEIGANVTSIGNYAFYYCYSIKSISIPNNVTSIGTYAFRYCYTMQSINIPTSITSIENYAFQSDYALQSISIPNNVTSIGTYAFQDDYALQSISIPSNVTNINNSAFSSCYALESISIPRSVTSIGNSVFSSCQRISTIFLSSSEPPTLGTNMISGTSDVVIYVPYSSDHSILESYKSATNWSSYASQMQEMPAP